ncbi:MAG: arsenate reductase (glutaredoxin) [Proteobacteria bacterium]|nr:arsenate reductase (glutaredoxin) [Pseudomonadota bacterium]
MNKVTIYHNPRCSKSRQTLELLKERDIDPEIILYLETAPSSSELTTLVSLLGMTPRELLRTSEPEYKEMRLDDTDLSDADIIKAMVDAPILMQRPIVVCGDRASLGRPPEQVLDIISI